MKTVNTTGLMLGMLVLGGLIAAGAMFAGQAFAQSSEQTATVGQANVNTDNDVQTATAILCNARFSIIGSNICANISD
jgi:hypothetical protein